MRVSPGQLRHGEKVGFAAACRAVEDERLIPSLAGLLDPRVAEVHWHATEALLEIDTSRAAEALQPYLPQEGNLERKLEISAYLARHGIDAGVPYALEHMADASLLEPAISVFSAVSSRDAVPTLREIVRTGNDTAWTGAAIRALAALGDQQIAPRALEIAEDLRDQLAPYALVALGRLGAPHTAAIFREGIRSRDDRIVAAAIRGAAALLARGEAEDASLRDGMARLLASADAGPEVRTAALEALMLLEDPRLDRALVVAAVDARLETTPLLVRIEELLEERQVAL
jgi:HEAT repeat protein